jgi:hypothetical protein
MQYTLNQVKAKLEEIASRHQQINEFGFGDVWEFGAKKSYIFPVMFAVPQPAVVNDKIIDLNFNIIFMDLVNKGEGNETEVLSDMLQVALDVRAWLLNDDFADDFIVEASSSLQPFTERFDEEVTGWVMALKIKIVDIKDRCAIPLDEDES